MRPYTRFTETFRLTRDGVPRLSRPANGLTILRRASAERARTARPYRWAIGGVVGIGGRAGEDTGPYGGYTETTPPSPAAFAKCEQRSPHQVPEASRAMQAERQRMFTARLKTGEHSPVPFARREPPPPRPKRQSCRPHQTSKAAPRLGVLRG